jgi:very-short-patch-repair endonuclease
MSRFDRTPQKTARAKRLRTDATPAERILWSKLRSAQVAGESFRRQHPIGPYVLDFYCPAVRLGIELDGEQHGLPDRIRGDGRRDQWLREQGIVVLRFWNTDIRGHLQDVMDQIANVVFERRRLLTPSRSASRSDLPLSGGGNAPFLDGEGDLDA